MQTVVVVTLCWLVEKNQCITPRFARNCSGFPVNWAFSSLTAWNTFCPIMLYNLKSFHPIGYIFAMEFHADNLQICKEMVIL